MRKTRQVILLVFVFMLLFSVCAFASQAEPDAEINSVSSPRLGVIGNQATCYALVTSSGNTINAHLELKQGGSVVASWDTSGSGVAMINETAAITHGLVYTLTLSGTINGISFTPQSVTRML